jgi:hypothetical protein
MEFPLSPRLLAGCTLGGAVTFSTADLLRRLATPDNGQDPVGIVHQVAEHSTTWLLAGSLATLSAFLLAPAALAITMLASGRGRVLTRLGGFLLAAGALASMAHMVGEFGFPAIRAAAGIDDAAMSALDHVGYGPAGAMIVVFILGFTLGLLLMMIGLRRAGVVPLWSVIAAVVAIAAGGSGGVAAGVVGVVAWLATLGPVAVALTRPSPVATASTAPALS